MCIRVLYSFIYVYLLFLFTSFFLLSFYFFYLLFFFLLFFSCFFFFFFFFFQAEDGIRDKLVTGVQTCALPISCTARCSTAGAFPSPLHWPRGRPRACSSSCSARCRGCRPWSTTDVHQDRKSVV